jgi:monovalent cation:H+ antiporter, CPA1 family
MRESLEQLLIVLAVGSGVAIFARRVNIPYNVALVIVGLLLVLTNIVPTTPMDPGVVLMVFLPILIFQGALSADAASLKLASRPILTLAFPAVAISLLVTAALTAGVIGLPFPVALLLGAVLAITDTVSVLLAFRSVRVPHRLAAIMEGESLFNDGTALVLVGVAATVVISGSVDAGEIGRTLFVAVVLGAVLGAMFGMLAAQVLRRAPDDLTAVLASLVAAFATSLVTEHFHGSAVIAVVVAGVLVGQEVRAEGDASRVLALEGFWEIAAFVTNVWLFLLVGIQLSADILLREAWPVALAVIALHIGRAAAVYGSFGGLHLLGERMPWAWQHVMVFGNIKGALSMAAVLSLPANVPYRERLIAIVFGVTLVTMVTQALPFKAFLRWLGVSGGAEDELAEECRAILIGARRAQTELDNLLATGLISRHDHAESWANYQRDIIDAERQLRDAGQASQAHVALPAVLTARKAAILDAARRGLITDRTAAKHVAVLDDQILRAERHDSVTED